MHGGVVRSPQRVRIQIVTPGLQHRWSATAVELEVHVDSTDNKHASLTVVGLEARSRN